MLKRKDDIRHRLTIAEVPKPPADLVHRIKHDIPRHFTSKTAQRAQRETRDRHSLPGFWGFSWQLAASVLVLVGLTWAIFVTWQSELTRSTQVADAASNVTSVEELEARATDLAPESMRIEAPAETGAAGEAFDEPKKNQIPSPAPAAVKPKDSFAPEMQAGRRQDSDPAAEAENADLREKAQTSADSSFADVPGAVEGIAGRDASRETAKSEPARMASAPPQAMSKPSAPTAAMPAQEAASLERARDAAREVMVKGLTTERIIQVELRLDETGKVVKASVKNVTDRAVIDAITEAARRWTFEAEEDDAGRVRLTRTIDVQLRKAK